MKQTQKDYIKQGDCLELMREIPDKSIDMILCDLPYGTTNNEWDSVIPLDKIWAHYKRVIKDNGAVVLFSQPPFTMVLGCSNLKQFRYEWTWVKECGTGFLNAKKMPLKSHENILVFYKKLPTYNPQMRYGFKPYKKSRSGKGSLNYRQLSPCSTESSGTRFPVDVIQFHRDTPRLHPTQKPVALLEYLIKTYTNENEVVLDNCMGVGSTCVAAINTNRRYIGFELDKKYFEIAKSRIKEAREKAK